MEFEKTDDLPRSSSRLSLKEEFENDIDASRASTPQSFRSERKEKRHRSLDHYKRKVARLRSELDAERARSKQMFKNKTEELKDLKETLKTDKKEVETLKDKLADDKEKEVKRIQDNKDKQLQQVLKYKDDELKKMKKDFRKGERALKEEIEKLRAGKCKENSIEMKKLEDNLQKMRHENRKLERMYRLKCESAKEKEKKFKELGDGYDKQLRSIISESRKVALGNLQKLKVAEIALSEPYVSDDESFTESERTSCFSILSKLDISGLETTPMATPTPCSTPRDKMFPEDTIPSRPSSAVIPSDRCGRKSAPILTAAMKQDRQLHKRVTELQIHVQRLERKIAILKTENESLKKKQEDQKPIQEKIKTLKKRNAELAAIARRLEEKAKNLQIENQRKSKDDNKNEVEHAKRLFARQRAKDLAEHAKNMLAKDREIEDLRKKCQELADQLSNTEYTGCENSQMYEEKEELVNIIKQAARERLVLERQVTKSKNGLTESEIKKVKELETNNEQLNHEVAKLHSALNETQKVEIALTQKSIECERISKNLQQEKDKNKLLEDEIELKASKATELTIQVSDLQSRLTQLENVNEECSDLRLTLTEAQQECETAKEEVSSLQHRISSLENLVKSLEKSKERLHQLERDYNNALDKLQEKQNEVSKLQEEQSKYTEENTQFIENLQRKIKELERQCSENEISQRELNSTIEKLKRQEKSKAKVKTVAVEIQTIRQEKRSVGIDARALPAQSNNSTKPSNNFQLIEEKINPVSTVSNELASESKSSIEHSKSSDTGFAEDEDAVDACKTLSPDLHSRNHFEDPELTEISKKLMELEAAETEDEILDRLEDKGGEDSGMESNREQQSYIHNLEATLADRLALLPNNGPIYVYIAKYTYDPLEHSPNENPEAELLIQAGEYVLVWGDMDEDGFYEGETIEGRRGLVPSNFIEKVADEDLGDFHAVIAAGNHQSVDDEPTTASIHQEFDFNSSDESDRLSDLPEDGRYRSSEPPGVDLQNISEGEELKSNWLNNLGTNNTQLELPHPKGISLDRQLTSSILISWRPPDGINRTDIESYQVSLDGKLCTSVKATDRTKALIENVDSRKVHRICVRCLSKFGLSKDGQCTMLIGKDAMPVPSNLAVTQITSNSAVISWLPANSNFQHIVSVSDKEGHVLKAGICRHTLSGLAAATKYSVTVKAKSSIINHQEEKNKKQKDSVSTEFSTLPGGLPDPPVNVQVEAGPQEGTILLTWLPVTINTSGFSNGAIVTGYMVYADGKVTKEAKGPTNDHIVLNPSDFKGFVPKQLAVHTVTVDGKESQDSNIVQLPQKLIREITAGAVAQLSPTQVSSKKKRKSPSRLDDQEDTDDDIDSAFAAAQELLGKSKAPVINGQFEQDFDESSNSELSDILEVDEDINDANNQNATASHRQTEKQPKPAPRQISSRSNKASGEKSKPAHSSSKVPQVATNVPVIEVTKDSGSEKGSFDVVEDSAAQQKTSQGSRIDDRHSSQISPQKVSSNSKEHKHSVSKENSQQSLPKQKIHKRDGSPRPSSHNDKDVTEYAIHKVATRTKDKIVNSDLNANDLKLTSRELNKFHNEDDLDYDDVDSITGEINPPFDENKVRLFIALFDYDPFTMSPNVDCIDEELPFKEGQIIKVFGNKDEDGFYRGEANGRVGYVPCNMVSEVQIEDTDLIEQLIKESQENPMSKAHLSGDTKEMYLKTESPGDISLSPNGIPPIPPDSVGQTMVALYDYDPQELSPNVDSEIELSFKAGDIIVIFGEMDDDGFFTGTMGARRGLVPSNFLQPAPEETTTTESASSFLPISTGEKSSSSSQLKDDVDKQQQETTTTVTLEDRSLEPLDLTPSSSLEDERRRKKGGVLSKGKNFFKRLAR